MKIPTTRPNWHTGRYSVVVDGLLVGYFRQFRSAWRWRNYSQALTPGRIEILDKGRVVNVSSGMTAPLADLRG